MDLRPKISVLLLALTLCHPARAAEQFGTVDDLSGSAYVTDSSGQTAPISVGMQIFAGETINSNHDSEVHIVTEDGGIIALRPDTAFHIDAYQANGDSADRTIMSLFQGAVRSITGWIGKHNPSSYLISTPTATIGVRGTDHEVTVVNTGDGDQPGTYDTVNSGSTILKTLQGKVDVKPGQFAFAPRDRSAAPFFLKQRPHFLAMRKLKIEKRILQRKEYLHGRLEKMRDVRIQHLKALRGKRLDQNKGTPNTLRERLEQRRDAAQREDRNILKERRKKLKRENDGSETDSSRDRPLRKRLAE